MLAAVSPFTVLETDFIAFESQRGGHLLVGEWPVSMFIIEVAASRLKEDFDRLAVGFANEGFAVVTASDVGEAADMTEDSAEGIRAFPGDGPGANASRADPADTSLIGIIGELHHASDLGKQLLDDEASVLIGEGVVFEATIGGSRLPSRLFRQRFREVSWVNEDPDGDGHLALMDQVVHHDGCAKVALRIDIGMSILKHHDGSGLGTIVLGGHIHPVATNGARKDLTLPNIFGYLALRSPVDRLRQWAEGVDLVAGKERRGHDRQ